MSDPLYTITGTEKLFKDLNADGSTFSITPSLLAQMNTSTFLRQEVYELNTDTDFEVIFDNRLQPTAGADANPNDTKLASGLGVTSTTDIIRMCYNDTYKLGETFILTLAHEGIHALEAKNWNLHGGTPTHTGADLVDVSATLSTSASLPPKDAITNAATYANFLATTEGLATIGQDVVYEQMAHSTDYPNLTSQGSTYDNSTSVLNPDAETDAKIWPLLKKQYPDIAKSYAPGVTCSYLTA